MQARLKKQNGIVIVELIGRVDVETAPPFRAACFRELKGQKLVFDFSGLCFVGSQGILPFLETLQSFYEAAPGSFKFSGVGAEFAKVFAATPLSIVEVYETAEKAMSAHLTPVPPRIPVALASAVAEHPSLQDYIAYRSEPILEKTSDFGLDDEREA